MTNIVPQLKALPLSLVRRLLADLLADLEAIPDHRARRGRVYPLSSLLFILLLASVGDGNGPVDAADFARDHRLWLRRLGLLGARVPKAQTLRRLLRDRGSNLLAELQPKVDRLTRCLEAQCKAHGARTDEAAEPLAACAIDGKTARRSGDETRGIPRAHIVSARLENGQVVGQAVVADKANELTAIRQLLADLPLSGRVVTLDAQGCYTDVARTIVEAGGRYLLAVKDNQPNLHHRLQQAFAHLDRSGNGVHDHSETVERGHGRRERRTCTLLSAAHGLLDALDPDQRWKGLNSVVRVVAERTAHGRTARSVRDYISNLPLTTGAAAMADLVRAHWGIENKTHWVLDDTFQEDRCRLRTGSAARNMAGLRRLALNILTIIQRYFWPSMSIRRLRKMVARNPAQLVPVRAS